MSRLVVVSNRVPPADRGPTGSEGGLAVALDAALREHGGVWFGWNGKVDRQPSETPELVESGNLTYATIGLSKRDYQEYYNGFANRTLWPLFHYRTDLTDLSRRNWEGYQRVNLRFASTIRPHLKRNDRIWVHDYHLIQMAEQLRTLGCRQRMGFFLHIPWPALELFLVLPNHRALVRALCAFDLVGFQTEADLNAFHDYIVLEAGGRVDSDGVVHAFDRTLRAGAFPIGIDTEEVAELAERAARSRHTKRLRDSLGSRSLIIGVDRLDYSKGLVQRVEALAHMLRAFPEHRGRVTLLQIAPASRTDVPAYAEIRQELEATVGHINGQYAEFDWVPIRYINRGYQRRTLFGFFHASQVGIVTPLRDGMNLVAKEFVACQEPEDPGALVLSRFAGAASELHDALIVNPHDIETVGDALHQALAMSLEERRERWSAMFKRISRHNVAAWRDGFLEALQQPRAAKSAAA